VRAGAKLADYHIMYGDHRNHDDVHERPRVKAVIRVW
jgi:hypothetical protein